MRLRRYWFEFDLPEEWHGRLNLSCGVTAYDVDDAQRLLCERVFEGGELPPIRRLIEDVDISTLDPNHVRPNMGVCVRRGVWFPLGYE
jgi:hypothetical protein